MKNADAQTGFSAVELLITLFVAAAFIATGYQLYSIIVKNGSEVRLRSVASNIAYDNLRRYASSLNTTTCIADSAPTPTPTIPAGSGLPSASITVTLSCPYGPTLALTKVLVSVKYGTPQQEVVHALYQTN
jgi:Tfp pilus assembly protein PilE